MKVKSKPAIAIIGAGVIGLTTAIELLRSGREKVTVLAADPPASTNMASTVATAIWHVYLVDPRDPNVLRWATVTLQELLILANGGQDVGIYNVRGFELFRRSTKHTPTWAGIPPYFRMLADKELRPYADVSWGYEIEAPLAEMETYLPWQLRMVEELGGLVEWGPMYHFGKLEDVPRDFDIVVNCTGLGARTLVPDSSVRPVRGQYLVVRSPESDPGPYIGDDEHPGGMSYMIPRRHDVCIGGTEEIDEDGMEFVTSIEEMIGRAAATCSWLDGYTRADVLRKVVGLRPFRENGVRLSCHLLADGRPVIHNYGHGGSGFSLAFGCARDVVGLVSEIDLEPEVGHKP